jgi:hypothetical protein
VSEARGTKRKVEALRRVREQFASERLTEEEE